MNSQLPGLQQKSHPTSSYVFMTRLRLVRPKCKKRSEAARSSDRATDRALRHGHNHKNLGKPNMTKLLDLPVECLQAVVAYSSSPNDLCALDETSRIVCNLTEPFWEKLALETFGIKKCSKAGGKAAWRKGKALTSPERGWHFVFQIEPKETLEQRAILDTHHGDHWTYCAVGGSGNSEVICLSEDSSKFAVLQNDEFYRKYALEEMFPEDHDRLAGELGRSGFAVMVLGCENHFIIYANGKLYVVGFKGHEKISDENNPIVPLRSVDLIPSLEDACGACSCSMKWGSNDLLPGTFIVNDEEISVWHFDDKTSTLSHVQTLETEEGKQYNAVAVSERHIVALLEDTTCLHLYDRSTGAKIAEQDFCLKGIGASQLPNFGPQLHVVGEIVVCTSFGDNGLCVWQLLTNETHHVPRVTNRDSDEVTSMVQVNGGGYTCFLSRAFNKMNATVWGFPESEQGLRNLQELVKRHTWVSGPPISIPINKKRRRDDM
ncbi:expressed unknown protein [Seminavis robusta]|uniref:F-box domain-containing protein n=1 Tax=Seminavis robusta TaxID=568900 RepID=A0A9N8HDP9_9STRA|nr:expressed unknown protein [Seminavis robusta]|eukprot:Sro353_g124400.1 n/a (490) ;mRNA; r:5016-6871